MQACTDGIDVRASEVGPREPLHACIRAAGVTKSFVPVARSAGTA